MTQQASGCNFNNTNLFCVSYALLWQPHWLFITLCSQVLLADLARRPPGASGTHTSNPCQQPSHICSSVDTPASYHNNNDCVQDGHHFQIASISPNAVSDMKAIDIYIISSCVHQCMKWCMKGRAGHQGALLCYGEIYSDAGTLPKDFSRHCRGL